MYELGIYNALVGADRRIDNVCSLLQNPRTAEEAKEYYKIANTDTSNNSIDDVSEQEVQNILIHYKKLGKNEDRYADSFNNIAAQYTDLSLIHILFMQRKNNITLLLLLINTSIKNIDFYC